MTKRRLLPSSLALTLWLASVAPCAAFNGAPDEPDASAAGAPWPSGWGEDHAAPLAVGDPNSPFVLGPDVGSGTCYAAASGGPRYAGTAVLPMGAWAHVVPSVVFKDATHETMSCKLGGAVMSRDVTAPNFTTPMQIGIGPYAAGSTFSADVQIDNVVIT